MTDLELKKKSRLSKLGLSKKAPTSNKPKTSHKIAPSYGFQKNEITKHLMHGSMLITCVNMATAPAHAATATPCSALRFTQLTPSFNMSSTTLNLIRKTIATIYCHRTYSIALTGMSASPSSSTTHGASIKKRSDTASASPKAWSPKSLNQFQKSFETP